MPLHGIFFILKCYGPACEAIQHDVCGETLVRNRIALQLSRLFNNKFKLS